MQIIAASLPANSAAIMQPVLPARKRSAPSLGRNSLALRSSLLCLLLRVLLREVSADHTATHGADDGVMAGVVPSHSTHHRALEAARGVCRACRSDEQRCCKQSDSSQASFHSKTPTSHS